ncbi:DNA-directed RNA polymerase subunit alpha [Candidatus Shapirobacteria bacterium]|nr:DNA-directed RNA polymerase subunit alpha [Candidatus Shapirobacteria bacterium]
MVDTSKFHINTLKTSATHGRFELTPLIGGFGHTLGNSLRRILLITIPGSAITSIKITGANHLFTTLPGVKEDLVDISLNLKKVKFTYNQDEPMVLHLHKKGAGVVTAADIEDSAICKVANPDQFIATLADSKSVLDIELKIERGVGYTLAKEQKTDVVGEIILDATFTPVVKANYEVIPTRLGKKSDFDKLIMEIWTDGSVEPLTALKIAAKDMIKSLSQIVDPKDFDDEVVTIDSNPVSSGSDISIEEIELPLRVTNALKKAGYITIDNLVKGGRADVSKSKNVGEKSLKIIDSWLKEKGFSWK